jgi:hypothetical protein
MGLGRRRQEIFSQLVEKRNSGHGERLALSADFFVECTEFHLDNGLEDALHVVFARNSVVNQMELR